MGIRKTPVKRKSLSHNSVKRKKVFVEGFFSRTIVMDSLGKSVMEVCGWLTRFPLRRMLRILIASNIHKYQSLQNVGQKE